EQGVVFQLDDHKNKDIQHGKDAGKQQRQFGRFEDCPDVSAHQAQRGNCRNNERKIETHVFGGREQQCKKYNQAHAHQQVLHRVDEGAVQHFDKEKYQERKHDKKNSVPDRAVRFLVTVNRQQQIDAERRFLYLVTAACPHLRIIPVQVKHIPAGVESVH